MKKITEGFYKSRFPRVVNGKKRKVFNFETKKWDKKVERWRVHNPNTISSDKLWPTIGYTCDQCRCGNSEGDLYLMSKKTVCLDCGLKLLKQVAKDAHYECMNCEAQGKIPIGEHLVTREMAVDAGEPSMEGSHYGIEYAQCPTCKGGGVVLNPEITMYKDIETALLALGVDIY